MDIINPIQITSGQIVSYNVPQNVQLWDAITSYSKGAIVTTNDCGAIRYESLVNNNIGNDPATSDEWLKLDSPANCFAMFDNRIGTQTHGDLAIDDGDIKIKINVDQNLSGFGFLNVIDVNEIYIKVVDNTFGLVYENTINMFVKADDDWYDWYFGGFREISAFVETDVNMPLSGTFEVEFRASPGLVAKVGQFIYGSLFEIGTTLYGVELELKDFSRVEEDDFGNITIVPRATSNRPTFPVIILHSRVDVVYRTLRKLKSKTILWIPTRDVRFRETLTLGFYRNLRIDLNHPGHSDCTLQITGVTN